MKTKQKVFIVQTDKNNNTTVAKGYIVAVKWQFNPLPYRMYLVQKQARNIGEVFADAFGIAPAELAYCAPDQLIVAPEPALLPETSPEVAKNE